MANQVSAYDRRVGAAAFRKLTVAIAFARRGAFGFGVT